MFKHIVTGLARAGTAVLAMGVGAMAFAGPGPEQGTPWVGQKGVTETVPQMMARAKLDPIYEPGQPLIEAKLEHEVDRSQVRQNPLSPAVPQWPPKPQNGFSILGGGGGSGPYLPQTVGVNFFATDRNQGPGYIPPDTMGDVGPTNIVVVVNGQIKSFDKAGNPGAINMSTDAWFATVRSTSSTSDPRVKYDPISGRWYLVIINVASSNNRILISVSSGPNPDTSTWTHYFFNLTSGGGGTADNSGFFDYPTLGVDANALYIGGNVFKGNFSGCTGFVVRKSSVTSGGPIVVTAFRSLATGTVDGPYTPQGVDNRDPAATEGYFVGVGSVSFGTLFVRRITTPGGTPAISANMQVNVPTTQLPQDFNIGGGAALDTLDDRLFAAKLCKNRLTGVTTLWTAHNIEVDTTGTANTAGNRNGSRWYQLGNLTTTPMLVQSGTLFDSAASNPKHYWIPSVVMSGQGHMAIGSTWGSALATEDPGVAVAGRLSSDALGTTQAPTFAVSSNFTYSTNPARWGDYSHTVVDPTDDMTIWTFQEYSSATNIWGIRVVQLKAPPPATPSSLAPASVAQGATTNIVVTGTSSSGSGFFYAGAGFNPITASVSGTGVTVNSVTFTDPTHVTLNVTVSGSAATGTRDVTITNPDGQSATGSNLLTITSTNNPVPTLTSMAPSSATAAGAGFNLVVTGTNFINGSIVRWNGANRTTTFNSGTQLTAAIPASDIAFVGTPSVTVFNPTPGGGTSNALTFTVNPIVLAPNAFSRIQGDAVSGGLADVGSSNNAYLVGAFRWDLPRLIPNLQWEFSHTSPASTASRIDVLVESNTNPGGLSQRIEVYNVSTTNWDLKDTFTTTTTDSVRTLSITTGASQYVAAGGIIKVRVGYFPIAPTGRVVQASIDQVQITHYP